MRKLYLIIAVTFVTLCSFSCSPKTVVIDDQVPAGNIVFERILNDTVYVHQSLRGSKKAWFYWAFRVRGAQGKKLTFVFTKSFAICERGPVVSLDKGKSYEYLAEEGSTPHSFTYTFPDDAKEVWFYECHPYTPEMWEAFLKAPHKGEFEIGVLCKTRKGRDVPFFRMTPRNSKPKFSVVLSARHHCSEAPAMYALEGLVATFLEDSELGDWLRENVELTVVPFVDMDGAVEGDQGKWRLPHDHNRDYTEFLYPETAALASLIAETEPQMFLDFHNPKLYKYNDNYIYTPYKEYNGVAELNFSALIEKYQEGGLKYQTSDNLPYGTSWNAKHNYTDGMNVTTWVATNIKTIEIVRTFEFPFAYSNGEFVYPNKLRKFGHGMARALRAYVEGEVLVDKMPEIEE
ncbi:MAG: hypothetical protein IKA07_01580 [Alistipes sp.]|nr:hypothetical protein [Alistipes sp.]